MYLEIVSRNSACSCTFFGNTFLNLFSSILYINIKFWIIELKEKSSRPVTSHQSPATKKRLQNTLKFCDNHEVMVSDWTLSSELSKMLGEMKNIIKNKNFTAFAGDYEKKRLSST